MAERAIPYAIQHAPPPDPNTPAIPDLTPAHPIDVAGQPETSGVIVVDESGDVGVVPVQGDLSEMDNENA